MAARTQVERDRKSNEKKRAMGMVPVTQWVWEKDREKILAAGARSRKALKKFLHEQQGVTA